MTRKALGRGLSALISEKPLEGEYLREIDIDLIEPNPEQPRSVFSESKLEELAQSIRENGLVQPILVRQISERRYQIVAGERRWRASQLAGLQRISAVIRAIEDVKLLELALIENIQRQELTPMEEAQAYQRLITNLELTQEDVAKRVGKDRSSIANYLRLLKLPERVQNLLESEAISMGHARALLSIDTVEGQSRVADEIIEKKLSVRETERLVQKLVSGVTGKDPSTPQQNDANIRAAELRLKRFLGTQVKIKSNGSSGKIEIDFSSASELDRVYSIIIRKSEPPSLS